MYNNVVQEQLAILLQNQVLYQQQIGQQQMHMHQQLLHRQLQFAQEPTNMNEVESCSNSEDEDDEDKRILFVANLDEQVTEELLYELFLQAGPLESVRIPKDNAGKQRTFGFVEFVHKCSIPYALELFDGLSLFRKSVTIKTKNGEDRQSFLAKRQDMPFNVMQQRNSMQPYNKFDDYRNQNQYDRGRDRERDRERERDYDRRYDRHNNRQQHYSHKSSNRHTDQRYNNQRR